MGEMTLVSWVVWRLVLIIISIIAIRSFAKQQRLLPLGSAMGAISKPAISALCAFNIGTEPKSL